MKIYAIGILILVTIVALLMTQRTVYQEHAAARLTAQAAALNESGYEMDISELCSLNQPENAHDCKMVGL